ncbi:hypothetical protein PROFUN_00479 [Planoprotostelium fungivorum]|uniref:Uncharacterized protein n=1 Tax=Planoprotostelium fungivorum TaxID=1890364 RepID=A0A2P6N0Y4_9EUKA|nr:hypothetical protein PROFUN_00479 [Planoprotostelium fungivorum]
MLCSSSEWTSLTQYDNSKSRLLNALFELRAFAWGAQYLELPALSAPAMPLPTGCVTHHADTVYTTSPARRSQTFTGKSHLFRELDQSLTCQTKNQRIASVISALICLLACASLSRFWSSALCLDVPIVMRGQSQFAQNKHPPVNDMDEAEATESSPFDYGPPMRLVLQWIDELWAQESSQRTTVDATTDEAVSPKELSLFNSCEDFQLLEPLRLNQRKSYSGESRFLSPKPVIILNSASPLVNNLKSCTVSFSLLDKDGCPLQSEDQDLLSSPNGKKAVLSIAHCRTAPICVKLIGKIETRSLRLGFIVDYDTEDGTTHQVWLTSNVFHLVRERSRDTPIRVSHVSMLRRNVKCE